MNHTHREKFQRLANTVIFSLTTNHSPPARGYGQRRLGYYHFIPLHGPLYRNRVQEALRGNIC